MSRTILFIHGAWMTPRSWDAFIRFFGSHGFRCLAPAWPYHDRPPAQLRAAPPSGLARVGLDDILDHYAGVIRELDDVPILIGHSLGGLIVQRLLDRGLGSAGVAIDAAAPRGVFGARPTTIRSLWPVLKSWRGWRKVIRPSFEAFRYGFVHRLPEDEQRRIFDEHVVPESGRIFYQAAMAPVEPRRSTAVNFRNPHRAPLLLIAGSEDHLVPASVARSTHKQHRRSRSATDLVEFPGRTHWIIAEPGWEEVAETILRWIESLPTVERKETAR